LHRQVHGEDEGRGAAELCDPGRNGPIRRDFEGAVSGKHFSVALAPRIEIPGASCCREDTVWSTHCTAPSRHDRVINALARIATYTAFAFVNVFFLPREAINVAILA
jgi:hypothetical protein